MINFICGNYAKILFDPILEVQIVFFFLFRRNSVKETYRKKELGRQGFERNIEHIYFNYFICIQDWGKESKHGFKNSKLEDQCTHR